MVYEHSKYEGFEEEMSLIDRAVSRQGFTLDARLDRKETMGGGIRLERVYNQPNGDSLSVTLDAQNWDHSRLTITAGHRVESLQNEFEGDWKSVNEFQKQLPQWLRQHEIPSD